MAVTKIQDLEVYIPFIDYLLSLGIGNHEKLLQIKGWILDNKRFSVEVLKKLEQSVLVQYRNLFLNDTKIPQYIMDIFNKKLETKVETINLCSDDEADAHEVPKEDDGNALSNGEIMDTEADTQRNMVIKDSTTSEQYTIKFLNKDKQAKNDNKTETGEDTNVVSAENLDEDTEALIARINDICQKAQTLNENDDKRTNGETVEIILDDEDDYIAKPLKETQLFTRRSNVNLKRKDKEFYGTIGHSTNISNNRNKVDSVTVSDVSGDRSTPSMLEGTLRESKEFKHTVHNEEVTNACDEENLEKLDIEELTAIFKSLIKYNKMDDNEDIDVILKQLSSNDTDFLNSQSPSPKLSTEYTYTNENSFSPPMETFNSWDVNRNQYCFNEPLIPQQNSLFPGLQPTPPAPQIPYVEQLTSPSNMFAILNVNGRKINLNDPRVRQQVKAFQNSPFFSAFTLTPRVPYQANVPVWKESRSTSVNPTTYGEYRRLKAEKEKEMQRRKEAEQMNKMEKINFNKSNEQNTPVCVEHVKPLKVKEAQRCEETKTDRETKVINTIKSNDRANDHAQRHKEAKSNSETKSINTIKSKERSNESNTVECGNHVKPPSVNDTQRREETKSNSEIKKIKTKKPKQRTLTKGQNKNTLEKHVNIKSLPESTDLKNRDQLPENANTFTTLETAENENNNTSFITNRVKRNYKKRKDKTNVNARILKELECSFIGFNKFTDYLPTSASGKRKSSETARNAIAKQLSREEVIGRNLALPKRRSSCNLSTDGIKKLSGTALPITGRRKTCTDGAISSCLLYQDSETNSDDDNDSIKSVSNTIVSSPPPISETSSSETEPFDYNEFMFTKTNSVVLKPQAVVLLKRLTQADIDSYMPSKTPTLPEQVVLDVQLVESRARDAPEDVITARTTTATKAKSKTVPNTDEQLTERTSLSCVLCRSRPANIVNHYIRVHKTESYVSRLTPLELENFQKNAFPFAIQCNSNGTVAKYKVRCVFCSDELVDTFNNFHSHYATHTGEYGFKCSNCQLPKPFRKDIQSHQNSVKACRNSRIQKIYLYPSNLMVIYLHCCRLCNFLQLNEANIYKHLREQHSKGSEDTSNVRKYIAAAINDAEIVNEVMTTEDDELLNQTSTTESIEEDLQTENGDITYDFDTRDVKPEFLSQELLCSEPPATCGIDSNTIITVIPEANVTAVVTPRTDNNIRDSEANVNAVVTPRTDNNMRDSEDKAESVSNLPHPIVVKEELIVPESEDCSSRVSEPFGATAVPSSIMTVIPKANLINTAFTSIGNRKTDLNMPTNSSDCSSSVSKLSKSSPAPNSFVTAIPKANLTNTELTGIDNMKLSTQSLAKNDLKITPPIIVKVEKHLQEPDVQLVLPESRYPAHSQYRTYSGNPSYYGLFKCSSSSCLFSTDDSSIMLQHLNDHLKGNSNFMLSPPVSFLECTYCKLPRGGCATAEELIAHISKYHMHSCFQCPLCCYRSCVAHNVILHQSISHALESGDRCVYQCKNFEDRNKFFNDNLTYMSKSMPSYVKALKCIHCSLGFFAVESMRKHLQKAHNRNLDESFFERYSCIYCGKNILLKSEMQKHLAMVHPDRLTYACKRNLIDNNMEDSISNLILLDIEENVDPTFILDRVGNLHEVPEQLESKPSTAELGHIWEEMVHALLNKLTNNTGIEPDHLYHCPIGTCGGFFSTYALWYRHMTLRHNCLLARCPHCPTYNELLLSEFQLHFEQHSRHLYVCFYCVKTFANESSTISHFQNDHSKEDCFRFEVVKFNIIHKYHIIINEKEHTVRVEFLQALKELIANRLNARDNEEKEKLLSNWLIPKNVDWLDNFIIPNRVVQRNCLLSDCTHVANDYDDLYQHLESKHDVRNINKFKCCKCSSCFLKFANWQPIVEHLKLHNSIYVCCVCDFQHFGRQMFSTHMQLEHNSRDVPYVKMYRSGEDAYLGFGIIFAAKRRTFSTLQTCFFCNVTNLNAETYSKHLKRVHNIFLDYYCEQCNVAIEKLGDANLHYEEKHSDSMLKLSCEFLSQRRITVLSFNPLKVEISHDETKPRAKRSLSNEPSLNVDNQIKRFKSNTSTVPRIKTEPMNDGGNESDASVEIIEEDDLVCMEELRADTNKEKTIAKICCKNFFNLL